MKDAGSALMGIGRASGENRAVEAARQAIASPLLEVNINGAQGILFNITGSSNLTPVRGDRGGRGDPRRRRPRGEHHLRDELQRAARRRGPDHRHRHRLRRRAASGTPARHEGAAAIPRLGSPRAPRPSADFLEELERQRRCRGRRSVGGRYRRRRDRGRASRPARTERSVGESAGPAERARPTTPTTSRSRASSAARSSPRPVGRRRRPDTRLTTATRPSSPDRRRARGRSSSSGSPTPAARAGRDPAHGPARGGRRRPCRPIASGRRSRPASTVLGENRVQEGEAKRAARRGGTWHLIGPLQSNKARRAVETFDVIESVDSVELARRLDRIVRDVAGSPARGAGARRADVCPVLLQVNVDDDPAQGRLRARGARSGTCPSSSRSARCGSTG